MEEAQRNIRSGYRLDSKRSSAALSEFTEAENFSKQTSSGNGKKFYFPRNRENGQMWRGDPLKRRTSHMFPYSRSAKEKWQVQISNRYEIPKCSSNGTEIQDGGARNVIKDARARRLHVHRGSSRWVPPYQHARIAIPYLGFQWEGRYYAYQVLPFGLAVSPLVFSKIMRSIVSHLRQLGHRILVYLDDFIGLSRSKSVVLRRKFLDLLCDLGLHISKEKSSLELEQAKEFLGLMVKTVERPMFYVPSKKKIEVTKEISRLLKKRSELLPARRVARVAGLCISLSRAVGPTRLLMRNLFKDLQRKPNWNAKIQLSEAAIQDLIWWKDVMEFWDGKIVVPSKADVVIYTDASNSGWGGAMDLKSARGFWTPAMMEESINYRELMAIFMSLLAFKEDIRNKAVLLRTDNISAAAYINKMTGSSDPLYLLGRAIANLSKELNCEIMAQYIPGVENIAADRLSRWVDKNDWMLHPRYFGLLEKKWGPHSIDRMASFTNHQVPRYNSYHWDPKAEAIDSYTQNWSKENNYVNPPFNQLERILSKIKEDSAVCTVIAPLWPAQPWFNTLLKMSVDIPQMIPNRYDTFLPGSSGNVEPLSNPKWEVAAFRVSGNSQQKIGLQELKRYLRKASNLRL
jgi:hypothetical protein